MSKNCTDTRGLTLPPKEIKPQPSTQPQPTTTDKK